MLSFRNSGRGGLASWLGITMFSVMSLTGCGGAPAPKSAQTQEVSAKQPARAERAAPVDAGPKAPAKKKKESDIPYDAFFDNPLEVADNKAVIAAPAGSGTTEQKPVEKPTTDAPATAGAGGWTELLPIENVQAEVKKIQNRLKASMQTPGTYNGNYKEIAVDGSVIAAMAQLALEHSGELSWKKNAPLIREYGHELAQAATGLGKDNYEKSKAAYEKLDSVFSGTIPPGAPNAPAKKPFSETADRDGLMKRIDKARGHLRDNINTEAKLKGDTDGIIHETMLIATLGKIVTTEGYSSADEQDYQQFAEALISGAKEATTAAKDQSFQKFTESMNKVNKSCDQCHANYGNG